MGRVGTRYGSPAAVGAVQEKHCLNGCASPHSAELAQMAVPTALSLLRWRAEQLSLERPAWEASAVCGRSCDIVRLNVCRRMHERTNHKASTCSGARKQHVAGLWNQNQMFSKARKAIIGREF